jgi:hypothetical protein
MKTQFLVDSMMVLKNGKLIIGGNMVNGKGPSAGMVGRNSSGSIEVEIVSIGMLNSPPAPPSARCYHVRVVKGASKELEGSTLAFEERNGQVAIKGARTEGRKTTESPFVETEPFDSPFQELRHKRPRLAEAPVVSLVVKSPVSSLRHDALRNMESAAITTRGIKALKGKATFGVSSLFSAVAEGEEIGRKGVS